MHHSPDDSDAMGSSASPLDPRRFTAEDEENGGPLFTAEELRAALVVACADPVEAEILAADWTPDPIEDPGTFFTEDIFLVVALTAPARAESIRRKLGYAPREFAHQLAATQRSLPWRFED
jgi:hypothetical protein